MEKSYLTFLKKRKMESVMLEEEHDLMDEFMKYEGNKQIFGE